MSQSSEIEAIITAYVEYIRPQFVLVVGVTPFCACLVTLLVPLFAFSTPSSRRLLTFRLNVLAICIALVTGILNGYLNAQALTDPFGPTPSLSICFTFAFFALVSPLFYDSILLLRLLAFYPIGSTPLLTVAKVLVLPIAVKCGRLSLFLHDYVVSFPISGPVANWSKNGYVTTEWALQLVDNMYTSGFFLYKLHSHGSKVSKFKFGGSFGRRIREIFLISAANFVFPVIFNIGQIICITIDKSYLTTTMLLLINGYVSVIGVLCATIWASSSNQAHAQNVQVLHSDSEPSRPPASERARAPLVHPRLGVYGMADNGPYAPSEIDCQKGGIDAVADVAESPRPPRTLVPYQDVYHS
ncbi:hypothetical protein ID866_7710 [Astraeus odoratus]|nr:hypothetical protein ID866_7710 [Astraeus odoratus]